MLLADPPLFKSQLSQDRSTILSNLNLPPIEKDLFTNIKCNSNTHINSVDKMEKESLPWRSTAFTQLASLLDRVHLSNRLKVRGATFINRTELQAKRASAKTIHSTNETTPRSLPLNCYSTEFINSLSKTERTLLNPQPSVDFESITAQLAISPCKSHTTIHVYIIQQQTRALILFISI